MNLEDLNAIMYIENLFNSKDRISLDILDNTVNDLYDSENFLSTDKENRLPKRKKIKSKQNSKETKQVKLILF